MFAAGGVTLLLVAAGGAYASGMLDGMLGVASDGKPLREEAAAEGAPATVTFYELPDLVVSLNTNERKSTFLKVRITLELADPAAVGRPSNA